MHKFSRGSSSNIFNSLIENLYKGIFISFSLIFLFGPIDLFAQNEINTQIKKGLNYSYNFNWNKAEETFQKLIRKYPNDPRGYHYEASVYLWYYLGNKNAEFLKSFVSYSDKAIEKARNILENQPKNNEVLYVIGADYTYRAIAFTKAENYLDAVWASKKSESYLSEALEADSSRFDAYLGLGLYNFAVGQIPSAYKWALNLAGISGTKETGIIYIKKAANKGDIAKVEAQYYLSQILSEVLINYDAASYYLKDLTKKYPENLLFNYSLAVLDIKQKNLSDAEKILLKIVDTDAPNFKQIISFSNFLLGDVNYRKNLFDSAIVYYNKFLQTTPDNDYTGIANYRLAICYNINGNREEAVNHFKNSSSGNMDLDDDIYAKRRSEIFIKRAPTPVEYDLIKSRNLIESGNYKEAIDSLHEFIDSIKTESLKAESYLFLSEALIEKGNYKKAFDYALSAKSMNANNEKWIKPFALFYAAKAKLKIGDKEAALYLLDEAEDYSDFDYQNKLKNMIYSLKPKD